MNRSTFTASEILRQLDEYAAQDMFPRLDAADRLEPGAVRLHAYRDPQRWAVVIEQLGFFRQTATIDVDLYSFGNCLPLGPGLHDDGLICPTDDAGDIPTFDLDHWGLVHPKARSINIRGREVPLNLDPKSLAAKGIRLRQPPRVRGVELLRSLLPDHRDELLATPEELHRLVPADLPELLRLDEWCHPDLSGGERPGRSEVFELIAEVLVTGDPKRYRPSQPPNTDWRNWPDQYDEPEA